MHSNNPRHNTVTFKTIPRLVLRLMGPTMLGEGLGWSGVASSFFWLDKWKLRWDRSLGGGGVCVCVGGKWRQAGDANLTEGEASTIDGECFAWHLGGL